MQVKIFWCLLWLVWRRWKARFSRNTRVSVLSVKNILRVRMGSVWAQANAWGLQIPGALLHAHVTHEKGKRKANSISLGNMLTPECRRGQRGIQVRLETGPHTLSAWQDLLWGADENLWKSSQDVPRWLWSSLQNPNASKTFFTWVCS